MKKPTEKIVSVSTSRSTPLAIAPLAAVRGGIGNVKYEDIKVVCGSSMG